MVDEEPAPAGASRPAVRTFHARTGRLSPAKRRLLDDVVPGYRLRPGERPVGLDFGCGSGEALLTRATHQPDRLWLGVDVHRASIAVAARALAASGLGNVRLELGDGVELLSRRIDVESLELVQILFPDPWPKAAQRHRRLVQAPFVDVLVDRLAPGGRLDLATDHADYAAQMADVLGASPRLQRRAAADDPGQATTTFYERRAVTAGRPVHRLSYVATG